MADFFRNLAGELTFANLASNSMWTLIFVALGRLAMWVFQITPRSEVSYWLAAPVVILALLVAASSFVRPNTTPRLSTQIEKMTLGEYTISTKEGVQTQQGAFFALVLTIKNIGAPTAVTSYNVSIKLSTGTELKGERTELPDMTIPYKDGTSEKLWAADSILLKTFAPISTGAIAQGIAFFTFPGITPELLRSAPDAILTLSFVDNWGKQWLVQRPLGIIGGTAAKPIGFPGLTKAKE